VYNGRVSARCSQHNLVAGADGLCTLCRSRSAAPPAVRSRASAKSAVTLLVASGLLAAGVALYVRLGHGGGSHAESIAPSDDRPRGDDAGTLRERRIADRAQELARDQEALDRQLAAADERLQMEAMQQRLETDRRHEVADERRQAEQGAQRRESDAHVAKVLERDREQRRQRSLERARGRVQVVVYSTRWCGACKALRGHLQAQGIAYVEHDIERDPAARAKCRALNPRGSVPTIDIEGTVLVGFSPRKIERAIAGAAQRATPI